MPKSCKIKALKARWVLDSRGLPTVQAECFSASGSSTAIVPSGASTGTHEALELRDGGKAFHGKGVKRAIGNINKAIAKKLHDKDAVKQSDIDALLCKLDNTPNKSRLGANATLAASMACCREAARSSGKQLFEHVASLYGNKKFVLPLPMMNIINGGKHAGNELAIQEYMILPTGAKSFREAVQMCSETFHTLKQIILQRYGKSATNVGDEGGFAPPLVTADGPVELILSAIKESGYQGKIQLGLDCAASEFYENGVYTIDRKQMSGAELIDFYSYLIDTFHIASFEDPFAEDDWENFSDFTKKAGNRTQIVGDDLLVTNVQRLKKAIAEKACNALLLKPNQIGTVSEAFAAVRLSQKNNFAVIVSHRSGDSEDSFIADLAVGLGNGQIKTGAPCRAERTAKYNRLLVIEDMLGKKAKYVRNILGH